MTATPGNGPDSERVGHGSGGFAPSSVSIYALFSSVFYSNLLHSQPLALLLQWTASQLLVRTLLIRSHTVLTRRRIQGLEEAPVSSQLKGRQARLEGPFQC